MPMKYRASGATGGRDALSPGSDQIGVSQADGLAPIARVSLIVDHGRRCRSANRDADTESALTLESSGRWGKESCLPDGCGPACGTWNAMKSAPLSVCVVIGAVWPTVGGAWANHRFVSVRRPAYGSAAASTLTPTRVDPGFPGLDSSQCSVEC